MRAVNPNLERISGWISSVGAAVALNDLDGDGLPNDLCHVDPRIDEITVAPVPGTGERYAPFALSPAPLPWPPTASTAENATVKINASRSDEMVSFFKNFMLLYLFGNCWIYMER